MVTDIFEGLLLELGKIFNLKLQPDKNQSCLIKLPGNMLIQLEIDHSGASLVIGCDLGTVPQGKYRENLFREALITNGFPGPHFGILAFSKQADKLILFENLPLKDLTGDKIATFLEPFSAKAKAWSEAISKGELPPIVSRKPSMGGMFGLK